MVALKAADSLVTAVTISMTMDQRHGVGALQSIDGDPRIAHFATRDSRGGCLYAKHRRCGTSQLAYPPLLAGV